MEQPRILLAVSGGIAAYKVPELVRVLRRSGARGALHPDARGARVRDAARAADALRRAGAQPALRSERGGRDRPHRARRLGAAAAGGPGDREPDGEARARPGRRSGQRRRPGDARADRTRARDEREHVAAPGDAGEPGRAARARRARRSVPKPASSPAAGRARGACRSRRRSPAAIAPWLGPRSLAGEVVLVTAGGTREPLDAVRFLGNRSSGKMGFAVAAEAARRGAEVVLVAGPGSQPTPAGVRRIDVESALAMRDAVFAELPRATIVIKSAAVADFRPARAVAGKLRKEDLPEGAGLSLELVRNPDILAEICRDKGRPRGGGLRRRERRSGRVRAPQARAQGLRPDRRERRLAARRGLRRRSQHRRRSCGRRATSSACPRSPRRDVAGQLLDRVEKLRGARG